MSRDLGSMPVGSIEIDRVWKRYRADSGRVQRGQILRRMLRRPKGHRYVLRDANVSIAPGEAVALIGLNGSGKSTLLKTIAGVTRPTAGTVTAAGRLGALIEVRGGIHPELSGRENIRFYGTAMGLTRRQVAERFDRIVEFAELENAIDRQVKFYSSGMQMRLGFSIAAFLEPDILLVDEALAVGDVGFQQRCIERMAEVLDEGTTLLFVSHDLAAMEAMCQRGIWLDGGVIRADGPVGQVLDDYRDGLQEKAQLLAEHASGVVKMPDSPTISAFDGGPAMAGKPARVSCRFVAEEAVQGTACLGLSPGPASPIIAVSQGISLPAGVSDYVVDLHDVPLPRGRYYLWMGVFGDGQQPMPWRPVGPADIGGPPRQVPPRGIVQQSAVQVQADWRPVTEPTHEPTHEPTQGSVEHAVEDSSRQEEVR